MSDLPTKHENYSSFVLSGGENDTIFDVPDTNNPGGNTGQGPTQANANAANIKPYARRRGRPSIGTGNE